MQVVPIKPKLKPPGAKRLILKYDGPLSGFAFELILRRYTKAASTEAAAAAARSPFTAGRCRLPVSKRC